MRKFCRFAAISAILVVGWWIIRTQVVQGLLLPVRVASGSMAVALVGPHWQFRCGDCGLRFRCGTDFPPHEFGAICPNCGFATNTPLRRCRGDRVLIDRLSLRFRSPRRWEVVALRINSPKGPLAVKRIVGLPGERVSLRHGDVTIDDQIVHRRPIRLMQMAVLVHDDRHRRQHSDSELNRWRPDNVHGSWQRVDKGFSYAPSSAASQTWPSDASPRQMPAAPRFDWLTYHHKACLPPPHQREAATQVFDSYGYNQSLRRGLNRVDDLIITMRLRWHGQGTFAARVHARDGPFEEIRWQFDNATVRLSRNKGLSVEALAPQFQVNGSAHVAIVYCDQRVSFAVNGRTVLSQELPLPHQMPKGHENPVSLGAMGFERLEVEQLRIWRDVYYQQPLNAQEPWSVELKDNQYLLLGDNNPVSIDGRHAPRFGIVSRDQIVGRVVPQATH